MKNNNKINKLGFHKAVVGTPIEVFLLRAMFLSVFLQFSFSFFVRELPETDMIACLAIYALAVLMGVWTSIFIFSGEKFKDDKVIFISEKSIVTICFFSLLPSIPDIVISYELAMTNVNVRQILLDNPGYRFMPPRVLMLSSALFTASYMYYLVFVKEKTPAMIAVVGAMVLLNSLVFASRSLFVILLIFYILNLRNIITLKNFMYVVLLTGALSAYTTVVQGRSGGEMLSLTIFIENIVYYSTYFAYPLYLGSMVDIVFGDVSIFYSIFGLPADVIETYFSHGKGELTTHLADIARQSWIGFDIFGHEHGFANVLYPQYAMLYSSLGMLGVFLFYYAVTIFICYLKAFDNMFYFARILGFYLIFETARGAALGTPGMWLVLLGAFSITIYLKMFTRQP